MCAYISLRRFQGTRIQNNYRGCNATMASPDLASFVNIAVIWLSPNRLRPNLMPVLSTLAPGAPVACQSAYLRVRQ